MLQEECLSPDFARFTTFSVGLLPTAYPKNVGVAVCGRKAPFSGVIRLQQTELAVVHRVSKAAQKQKG